ncbi:MAG TPA: ROK family protein [Pelobium sp.]|nr:ROK family protein [Pelobium sp.]
MKKADNSIIIGADIGGSHITAAIVDINKKCLIGNIVRKNVNSKGSKVAILETWVNAVKEVILPYHGELDKLAFAMPGPFDYSKGISLIKGLDKFEAIYGLNVKSYMSNALNIPEENILFRNDAEAFLHGEMFCGAGKDCQKAIGLTLGTGFGSAISQDGFTKDLNLGSEPFRKSIADDYFSTRWFIGRYWALKGEKPANVKAFLDLANIDIQADIFEEFSLNLADFLSRYLINGDTVILGGNIAQSSHLFLPLLERNLSKQNLNITFKLAGLNEEAALIGAAASFESISV